MSDYRKIEHLRSEVERLSADLARATARIAGLESEAKPVRTPPPATAAVLRFAEAAQDDAIFTGPMQAIWRQFLDEWRGRDTP